MGSAGCNTDAGDREPRILIAILLVLVTGLAFGFRLLLLCSSAEPLGTDGYYYAVQVEDLLAHGRLHVPDASWVLRFLGGCHLLAADPVFAVKAGSALLAAACVPAAWWAGRSIGIRLHGREGAGLAWPLAFWAAASPTLTHLAADFPKNLGLLAPALACLALLVRPGRRTARLAAAVAFAALAVTAHRLGAGLAALAGPGCLLGWLLGPRRAGRQGRIDWPAVWLLGGSAALFAVASLTLPGLLHPADLQRLSGQLDLSLHAPPPFAWFALRPTHPAQQVELTLPWAALVLGIWAWVRKRERRPLLGALLLPLVVCLLPPWRTDVLDMGFRLGLMAPLLAAPLALAACPRIRLPQSRLVFPSLFALGLVLSPLSRFGADPADTPPYDRYRALIQKIPRPLPELLIAHQGINFLYDHETGREAMAWAPDTNLDRRKVGRLAWGVRDGEWLACMPQDSDAPQPVRLDADYVYVREDVWERLVECAEQDRDEDLLQRIQDRRNPSRARSEALLRNRPSRS